MPEIRAELKNIRNVSLKSRVVWPKGGDPEIVTSVSFQYEGEPSEMETILMAETQGTRIHTEFYSEQLPLDFGKKALGSSDASEEEKETAAVKS